jgi:hypothetical protein
MRPKVPTCAIFLEKLELQLDLSALMRATFSETSSCIGEEIGTLREKLFRKVTRMSVSERRACAPGRADCAWNLLEIAFLS